MNKDFFRGFLLPGEWDGEEQIKSFILSCENEQEYIISNIAEFDNLEEHLRRRILVIGESSRSNGKQFINIEKILS